MTDDGAYDTSAVMLPAAAADGVVDLDPERKAAMVSNTLVVLCSEHPTQPIVNAGTLYQ